MNTATVTFELAETSEHLQKLVADLHKGRVDERGEPSLCLDLAHVLDHICRAWNCKDMTPEQWGSLLQTEFERLSNTVPNFFPGDRVLGAYALS